MVMKRLLLTSLLLLFICVCFSQIDTFRMDGKTHCLWVDTNTIKKTTSLKIVCVNTFDTMRPKSLYHLKDKTGNFIYIYVNSGQIDGFRDFLIKVRDKYEEWSLVAKENNVTKLMKRMDFTSDDYECFAQKKVNDTTVQTIVCLCYDFDKEQCVNFYPLFRVRDSLIKVFLFCEIDNNWNYSRGYDKELFKNTVSFVFSSTDEINSLIRCLEKDNIELLTQAYRDEKARKAEEKKKQQEIYDKFK